MDVQLAMQFANLLPDIFNTPPDMHRLARKAASGCIRTDSFYAMCS